MSKKPASAPFAGHPMPAPHPMENKSPQVRRALEQIFPGTREALAQLRCPFCNNPIRPEDFDSALSIREYSISGLCQRCQDKAFAEPEED